MQSIARLARFAVANAIREHDEKSRRVERLILTEEFTGKFGADKLRAAPGCSVHDQNGVGNFSLRIFVDLADRSIMNPQFGQRFAVREFEIVNRVLALSRRRIIGGQRNTGRGDQQSDYEYSESRDHLFRRCRSAWTCVSKLVWVVSIS